MGRKARGGCNVASGSIGLRVKVDNGMEARGVVEGNGDGGSLAVAMAAGERVALMEEGVLGVVGEDEEVEGAVEGMGIEHMVYEVLGGGETAWPRLKAVGGGAGAGQSPEVEMDGWRRIRSGWNMVVPALVAEGKRVVEIARGEKVLGAILGGNLQAPAVAGQMAGDGRKLAGVPS